MCIRDSADTIAGNCDTTLFLGGKEKTTLKEMSEILGKETIDSFNTCLLYTSKGSILTEYSYNSLNKRMKCFCVNIPCA